MKNSNRRYFLRNASLSATGVLLMSRTGARKSMRRTSGISCAPQTNFALTGTVSSVKSGKWSDAATWGGKVPGAGDTPLIAAGHTVVYDVANSTVTGVNVNSGGILQFDNLTNCTLQSTQNIVVEGTLQMRPNTPTVIHTLRFTGFDEARFVGGGMDVLATDVGLWVMGTGKLDLAGSTKTSWLKAGGAVAAGSTSIGLETSPTGWLESDELVITPTGAPGTSEYSNWTSTTVKSVSGAMVSVSGSVLSHPKVNNLYTAEVMNLTRNVRVEGTPNSKTHIFIRSTAVQTVKFAQIRYVGPRNDRGGSTDKELVAGRYGIHFHHCDEGSRGSQIEGNVIRDCDNHTYVPHVSHGVKFLDNIAYNVTEIAFWFDPGDPTHDAIFDHNIAALVKFVPRSLDMNAEDSPTFASSGFSLNSGDGNICRNNVVVGTIGDPATGGGYNWESVINDGVWAFQNNMSHNCHCGIRIWQNTTLNHTIEDFHGYHNDLGIFHGAYANRYNYRNMVLYGCGLVIKAASVDSNRVRFENMTIDGAGLVDFCVQVIESPLDGMVPLFLRNLNLKGARKAAISDQSPEFYKCIDVIACNITGNPYYLPDGISAKEMIRVQPSSGQPFAIVRKDLTGVVDGILGVVGGVIGQLVTEWNGRKTDIAQFAPTLWGNGNGLKAEYYNGTNFNSPAFTRIDPNISFYEWGNQIHHLITNTSSYSIRWTGQIQPQYTEAYSFTVGAGGGYRVWVNNQQIMNSWQENYPQGYTSGAINLVAGQKYDIKIEFYNGDARSGMSLMWESKSLAREYVPQSQLYTDAISSPPPTNVGPVANAGADITIQLPTNSTTLNGSASNDPDGSIVKYTWTKLTGPTTGLIVSPISSTSQLTQLVEGTYVFRLQVTDDKGLTGEDQVTVIVKPDVAPPANQPPVANAGADITIQLPVDYTTLKGSGSDPEGAGVSFKWTLAGGTATPHTFLTDSAAQTDVTGLVAGAYVFRLTVTDNKGVTASDDVTVTVKAATSTPPPANKPPVAKAGNDISMNLPTNSCTLNGSGTDSDGTIKSYKWELVGGSATQYILSNPTSALTGLSNLVQGNYIFRLTVMDNSGATASDDITVTVNAAPGSPGGGGGGGTNPNPTDPPILLKPLIVTVAPNPTTSVWKMKITSSSQLPITVRVYDSRGNLVTTINNVSNSANLTVGAFLRRGTYVAVVEQGIQKKLVTIIKL